MSDGPLQADVCIVGAGAAGAIATLELARRGLRVVTLEAGPRYDAAGRAGEARRAARGDAPWVAPVRELLRYTARGGVAYELGPRRVRAVGGTTLHWEGYTLRLHSDDLRLRTQYGLADDWPITYEDLEPYYVRAEQALGVAGVADDPSGPPRSVEFPLPPFPFSHTDHIFAEACGRLGVALHHLPQARNSIPYDGRSQCRACSTCEACPTGAKASVDLTHIGRAEATGNVTLASGAVVIRLDTDGTGRVEQAVYVDPTGVRRTARAGVFVLAGGAVENVRLLLASRSRTFPDGLGNRSKLVGTHFTSHPAVDVTGRVERAVRPYRIGFSTAMSRQFALGPDRARRAPFILEFLNSAGLPPHLLALTSGLSGDAVQRHVAREFGHTLGIRIYCEQLPDPGNTVDLDPSVTDHLGMPVPRLTWNVGDYERRGLDEAATLATRILQAAGATDVRTGRLSVAAHQIATHRMGRDAAHSVTNSDLRIHDVPNVYLLGSGVFPTASASPPTLTIAALAIRAAEHIAASLQSGVGRRET